MFDYRNLAERRTVMLLAKAYRHQQVSGKITEGDQKYFNGFIDAALMLDAYTPERLDELVNQANLEVFGMSLEERKRSRDYRSNPELLDTPACFRNGKVSDAIRRVRRG